MRGKGSAGTVGLLHDIPSPGAGLVRPGAAAVRLKPPPLRVVSGVLLLHVMCGLLGFLIAWQLTALVQGLQQAK